MVFSWLYAEYEFQRFRGEYTQRLYMKYRHLLHPITLYLNIYH